MTLRRKSLTDLLKSFRFWLFVFFLLRLVSITHAPTETTHSWRQCFTNMVTRNFVEVDNNIIYPRISTNGNSGDIIGSEFPVFNYVNYIFSIPFGFDHWYGRLINLIVSTLGIYCFYLILRNTLSEEIAFPSAILLLFSIWFMFSRKIMPDTFSVSLVIIGWYYLFHFFRSHKILHLSLFAIFATLGVLSKIPALTLLVPIPLFFYVFSLNKKQIIQICIASFIIILSTGIWYFYWVPYLISIDNHKLFFPKTMGEGLNEIIPYLPQALEKFYFSSFYSYLAFCFFIFGIIILIQKKGFELWIFTITLLVFIVFILKTGAVFPMHNYYIIPFVPIMALVAGYGLSFVPIKYRMIILFAISCESILNQQHDFLKKSEHEYLITIEEKLNNYMEKGDLIIVNGGINPQLIYFTHHRGWSLEPGDAHNEEKIKSFKKKGAKYLLLDKAVLQKNEMYPGVKLFEDENFYLILL